MRISAALITILLVAMLSVGFAGQNWVYVDGYESQPEISVLKSTINETVIEVDVNGFYTDDIIDNGRSFKALSFPGYYTTLEVGKPQLPAISEIVAVPANAEIRIIIESYTENKVSGFDVYPFQTPVPEGVTSTVFDYDEDVYRKDNLYPEMIAQIDNPGKWRNLDVINLKLYPVRYNPVSRELTIYTNIRIRLEYSGASLSYGNNRAVPESFDRIFRSAVINYKELNLPVRYFDGQSKDYDYLIIAADTYVAAMGSFVNYKNSIGLQAHIIPMSSLGNTPELIRAFIIGEYQNEDISYVLLVGNELDIPGYTGYSSFSDYYYALMDNDDYADIGVGRFCVHNSMELDYMLEKSVAYESNPPAGDWLDNALLVAHREQAPLKYQQCKEQIRLATDTPSGTYSVLYPEFFTAYGADAAQGGDNATNADVIEYINDGMRVVNYRGHGSNTQWTSWNVTYQYFGPAQVDSLHNGAMTPVVFGIACYNGNVENNGYCLAECFTLAEDAAVAFLGASRPSYTTANHTYDKQIFSAIFDEGINAISDATNLAAARMITQHGASGLTNARMYLWFGDPSLQVIYDQPLPRTRYVPEEYHTIQDAIDACNGYDTVMVAPGTYNESIDFLGKNIIVTSSGGASVTTIRGIYRSRAVVYFQSGEPKGATLSGFTITFGQKSGIYAYRSSPTIKDCVIVGNYSNEAGVGGGIDLNGTVGAVIRGNTLVENSAFDLGAGIFIERGRNDTIAYNLIYKNIGEVEIRAIASTALIHNNIILESDTPGNLITAEEEGMLTLRSNIIMGAARCGVYADNGAEATVAYNCFYHNEENWCGHVIVGAGNVFENPRLTKDFRTPPSSVCLDAGYPGIVEPSPYWLDPDGTRNDIGVFPVYQVFDTERAVFHEIYRAVQAVADGDFVYVHEGSYIGFSFLGKRIVVTSADGPEATIISGSHFEAATVRFTNHEPKGAELSGFTVRMGARSGIYCSGSSPTIKDNVIQENSSSEEYRGGGLTLDHTAYSVIRGNTFTHNASQGFGGGIVALYCQNDTICYNLFESIYGRSVIHTENCTMAIYNNTIDGRYAGGHGIFACCSGSLNCRNNIIVNAANYGFFATDGGDILAEYNDVWHYGVAPYGGSIHWGTGNIDEDPRFINYYRLDQASPCIDAGDPAEFFKDPDNTRNDMGWKALSMHLAQGIVDVTDNVALPASFALSQNYPNPFNASSIIKFTLPEDSRVNLTVYDILGRTVTTLVDEFMPAGYHQVIWNAGGLPSGTYFYKITSGNFTSTKKMILLK